MKKPLFILFLFLFSFAVSAQQTIDLSGRWQFAIDKNDIGIKEAWFAKQLPDRINLPASMPEKLKGDPVDVNTQWTGSLYDSSFYFNPYMEKFRMEEHFKVPFFLTPDKHYVGVAWYQKETVIPATWKGERIVLFMERPHIETTVWVNHQEVGMQNSLCVPHEYDITQFVSTGKCLISVRVDNRIKEINVGPDSHSITDQTQGNWNGIVGKINLFTTPDVYFDDIQIYPDPANRKAKVKMKIKTTSPRKTNINITLSAQSFNSKQKHTVVPVSQTFTISQSEEECEMTLPIGEGMLTWDEFDPALYMLAAKLSYGKKSEVKSIQFGMREFTIKGKWFYVNGNKTMLRGTVENCTFPLTGYAPTDAKEWERIFRICRKYGLNHLRFHSYCPPEAAFIAADLVGFYLQPEGPSWPNHGVKLGNGQPIDTYLMDETIRLTKRYGNYASFCMLACGNEPAGRWVPWVTDFVEYWRTTDSRRVYTGASVGGSWQWQPGNQFHVKAGARGLNWNSRQPESLSDYRAQIDTVKQPFVSHETGQWCAFPNFNEIRKYTGVNKAGNFEIFKEILDDNHLGSKGNDFLMASGKLQAICYKNEIEKTLRTPGYAGFQLLSLNDYSGQGTALVGLLDVFWEEKGYIDATEMRRFCSPTVLLSRIPKFTYKNNETFEAAIEIAHFHKEPIQNAKVGYAIKDEYGKVYEQGEIVTTDIPIGNCFDLGRVSFDLHRITSPQKLKLEVYIDGTSIANDWNFWVYPSEIEINTGNVYITDTLDNKAKTVLEQGGNVLVTAARKISYGKDIVQYMTPVFWNTSWFKMRPPHTTGIWVNDKHPLFRHFPTDYHSDLQWWELLNKSQVMQFTRFAANFQPLVQSIDTWFISRKAGVLFEANVLHGKLIMTSMDIDSDPDKRFVARQMRKAILDYMNSDDFRPRDVVDPQQIGELFTLIAPKVDSYTKDSPDELKPTKGDPPARDRQTAYSFDFRKEKELPSEISVAVPDGNYKITLLIGSEKDAGATTVRGESRRLFIENLSTGKGEFVERTFVVNKRDTRISEGEYVRIKPREKNKRNWDDKLTLEFSGDAPRVASLKIEKEDHATTVFLCGNSTVVDQDNEPWASWGQMIPRFFDERVAVANYAESGESANTFISAGRLKKLLTQMKTGDYVFIEFGHNDQKQKGPGKGAYQSFAESLKTFVDEARTKGAYPVLVTPTQRRSFKDGKIADTHDDYPEAMRWLAQKEKVALIDLHAMTRTLYEALGEEKSKKAFVHYPPNTFQGQPEALEDNTHFNTYGAYQIAKCVVEGIKLANLPLADHLLPDNQSYNPALPDAPESFYWVPSRFVEIEKPDGN